MDWKDEIRKTIFRQLPEVEDETAVYASLDPKQLHNPKDDLPIWEKTARAAHDVMLYGALEDELRDLPKTPPEESLYESSDESSNESSKEMHHAPAKGSSDEEPDKLPKETAKKAPEEKQAEGEKAAAEKNSGGIPQEAREWLFKENMRLEGLRNELDKASRMLREQADQIKAEGLRLEQDKKLFAKEKEEFKREMKDWNEQIKFSKKSLNEEKTLFDKKYKVLEMGFAKLNEDKKAFEAQKRAFEYKKKFMNEAGSFAALDEEGTAFSGDYLFFKGVSHPMAIKKRYKELIKIYHPDNTDGDKYILQRINQEYDRIRRHQP